MDDAFIKEFIEKKGRISASRLVMATTATGTTDAAGDNSSDDWIIIAIGGNGA